MTRMAVASSNSLEIESFHIPHIPAVAVCGYSNSEVPVPSPVYTHTYTVHVHPCSVTPVHIAYSNSPFTSTHDSRVIHA